MISVAQALDELLALVEPTGTETVHLTTAADRILARDVIARRAQPPFAASAMDGYGVATAAPALGDKFQVIGEAAAGHAFHGKVGSGDAVRIFTGAPVPKGVVRVVLQEDVERQGDTATITGKIGLSNNIRPAGGDFQIGDTLDAPRRLGPADIALAASMNCPVLEVARKPVIALIATGDELVMPGETPRDDQIIASNAFGLQALFDRAGATTRLIPIARDTPDSLKTALDLANGSDLIVTIGGASVGDHDIVGQVAAQMGLERAFYKVAMRPGKPLMAGRLGDAVLVGLPGNPVSSMVCGEIFVLPMLNKMLGLQAGPRHRKTVSLASPLPANGPREHYMRARNSPDGVRAFDQQDSSLLSILAEANALIVRPPSDAPRETGDDVQIIPI